MAIRFMLFHLTLFSGRSLFHIFHYRKNAGTHETWIALPEKSIGGKEKCRIRPRGIRQNDTQYRNFRLFIFELMFFEH